MTMRYLNLLLLKNVLHKSQFNQLKLISRKYASCGVAYWDRPITTKIKLEIEDYWRDKVVSLSHNRTTNEKNKFYVLSMFPYPSGSLHMGHVRVYTLSDTIARYYRMNDKYVIHPIGWDAFGLPAENAAIERNINPSKWTEDNIAQMREQLKALGCSFDWDRELSTCDPKYYKWTQELFLKLYDRSLVYKKEDYVNWDPVDQTVLANEQVSEDGTSWRSGAKVEKKLLSQWFIKTTAFAESLLEGLNDPTLKEWRDIKKIQRNWIGQCNGSTFRFKLVSDNPEYPKSMDIWTNYPEFIKEAKFIAISRNSIFNKKVFQKDEKVPTIRISNVSFINPFTQKRVPVFLTEEFEFPDGRDIFLGIPNVSEKEANFCYAEGIEFESSEILSTDDRNKKRNEILLEARERNIGGYMSSSQLNDWLISRQRYWGTPIPIIHCDDCGDQAVPRHQLPVVLPKLDQSSNDKKLINIDEWKKVECPKCQKPANREVDTMDTFVDSSWYYMRYLDPNYEKEMVDVEKANKFLPVDLYIGGKEHALLHLYFARFVSHFLHSLKLVPTCEPFKQLLVIGMVMGKTYRVIKTGKYISESEVEKVGDSEYVEKSSGLPVKTSWDKMSKSKYNGVDPIEMFATHSCDTIRLIIMSDAAPVSQRNWSAESFDIITNWENKLWLLMRQFLKVRNQFANGELQINEEEVEEDDNDMFQQRNYHLKGVCYNILGSQQLSVAISKMQSLTKRLRKITSSGMAGSREFERALATQLIMLAPLAPHFASELWAGFRSAPGRIVNDGEIQWDKEVLEQKWPQIDMEFKLNLNVFVNNRLVEHIPMQRKQLINSTLEELLAVVEKSSKIQKLLNGWEIVDAKTYSLCDIDKDIRLTTKRVQEKISQETSV